MQAVDSTPRWRVPRPLGGHKMRVDEVAVEAKTSEEDEHEGIVNGIEGVRNVAQEAAKALGLLPVRPCEAANKTMADGRWQLILKENRTKKRVIKFFNYIYN